MEEGALGVTQLLTRSVIPVAVLSASVGLVTIGCDAFWSRFHQPTHYGSRSAHPRISGGRAEGIAVGLCGLISLFGVVVLVQTVRFRETATPRYPPAAVLLALALLAMGLPTLLWRTRARIASEGVATIAIATASVVAGFSIGFVFVPLAVLMMWVVSQHLL